MAAEAEEFDTSVRVYIRIRPLNRRELAENQTIGWNFNQTSMLEDTQNGQRVYAYDHVFGPKSTNQETYDLVGKPVVLKAMDGYNGTVFTYGQTGSGKTWTMRGSDEDPGMMILCIRDIFDYINDHPKQKFALSVSYMEVYNEEINDLLNTGPTSRNLKIASDDNTRGAIIKGLVDEKVTTPDEFMQVLYKGEENRSYASTSMNDNSSRSHVIYRVTIEISEALEEDDDEMDGNGFQSFNSKGPSAITRVSYMNLVDLAGSERQKSTNATGQTLKEGANINKSLLTLGNVINKLGQAGKGKGKGKKDFIPYRDSKLTRILKQSLGGNTLTSVLCAVTPAPMHREETVSTLKFGQLCKLIKNNVSSNVIVDDKTLMKQYRNEILALKKSLEDASSGVIGVMASKERGEYDKRMKALESLVIESGGDLSSVPVIDIEPFTAGATGGQAENAEQAAQIAEMSHRIKKLTEEAEEHGDLVDLKASIEDYERNSRAELEEEKQKLEADKQHFSAERYTILQDKTALNEKEEKVGTLLSNLDEKESKLRQVLATLKEQQEQWKRAVKDLQRREDLVDEWQHNHQMRENKLQDVRRLQEQTFEQIKEREDATRTGEAALNVRLREAQEREQRLQVALSRTAKAEQEAAAFEDSLKAYEDGVKKRELDCDMKSREIALKHRELDNYDALLKDKDNKISNAQDALDKNDVRIMEREENLRLNLAEYAKNLTDLKNREHLLLQRQEEASEAEASRREKEQILTDKMRTFERYCDELNRREEKVANREAEVSKQMVKLNEIQQREVDLATRIAEHKRKEDEFFNVHVQSITIRHAHEMSELESVVKEQLETIGKFQTELGRVKEELKASNNRNDEYQHTLLQRDRLVEQLRAEMLLLSDRGFGDTVHDHFDVLAAASALHRRKSGAHNESKERGNDGDLDSLGDDSPDRESRVTFEDMSSPERRLSQSRLDMTLRSVERQPSSEQELILQLAGTQRLLHNILQSNHATPSKRAALLRRSFHHAEANGDSPMTPRSMGPASELQEDKSKNKAVLDSAEMARRSTLSALQARFFDDSSHPDESPIGAGADASIEHGMKEVLDDEEELNSGLPSDAIPEFASPTSVGPLTTADLDKSPPPNPVEVADEVGADIERDAPRVGLNLEAKLEALNESPASDLPPHHAKRIRSDHSQAVRDMLSFGTKSQKPMRSTITQPTKSFQLKTTEAGQRESLIDNKKKLYRKIEGQNPNARGQFSVNMGDGHDPYPYAGSIAVKRGEQSGKFRQEPTKSPEGRSHSPDRDTFDIDDPVMGAFIERGKRRGVPVTRVEVSFGSQSRKLVQAAKERKPEQHF